MTLTQLHVFLVVVEKGNFTLAAEQLYMTQSAVSHAIASLEKELGVLLLERQRAGVITTSIGEQLLMRARTIIDQTECIRQEMAAARGIATGKLRIGSFSSVSRGVLPALLGSFRRKYPGITITLLEGTNQEVYDWLISRAVDISVVILPVTGVDTIPLVTDELVAFLPPDHALVQHTTIQIEQIAADPFIMPKGGCEPLIRTIFERAGVIPHIAFEASETEAILAMVQEGLGVTIVPRLSLSVDTSHLQALPLDPPIHRELGLAVRSSASLTPAMEAFFHHAENI
ncbi:LysR family transcriptional regulator [Ktedonospora formicarum]|uniref:LysR family transcriptional regulator n=1 Tax=Ktedonospora formicarum TaxID=2778364 RepID=A0A8J3IBT2_9CHLR|nr:LysR substrate-binding domain-containing protein [Ktedonospora formicarum]GHO51083.1 LysR family transcriptional regulator [Ktedonospora formicarum]